MINNYLLGILISFGQNEIQKFTPWKLRLKHTMLTILTVLFAVPSQNKATTQKQPYKNFPKHKRSNTLKSIIFLLVLLFYQ